MWQEYFAQGLVVGLDLEANPFTHMPDRVRFYRGSQDDHALLDRIARECAPEGFDIVLDDASHVGTLARASFRKLFGEHLKRGGLYVVEDWGTGYWDAWSDGRRYSDGRREARAGARHAGEDSRPLPEDAGHAAAVAFGHRSRFRRAQLRHGGLRQGTRGRDCVAGHHVAGSRQPVPGSTRLADPRADDPSGSRLRRASSDRGRGAPPGRASSTSTCMRR
jgi:hypothetical protein